MSDVLPINADGQAGLFTGTKQRMMDLYVRGSCELYGLDAKLRALAAEPEEGAATAEYAIVLIAATAFAGVLMTVLKSDAAKTLLTNIVKKALNVG
ncbi:DUF4244 domain-containing protein [Bifidobacterium sp. 82T10]|uniref:DUF4244 domain-containing protein n=1 Tax=Bifidobacterium miconis TaxID=2834435 RepID=A0ABS6WG58_9BIFI|nr:DUF4244 domain-containing protein [Bifidobacterium miconis]MBW3093031.1 DUF4244 domain-containing protein [Bifidobacterium miconis]